MCCTNSGSLRPQAVTNATTAPTVGQELQSLEDAYKKGVITKEQYEEAKKKVLEKAGK